MPQSPTARYHQPGTQVRPEPPPNDRFFWLRLDGVTRLAASLRAAHWDDASAPALPVAEAELPALVHSFDQQPIYGWDFLDLGDDAWAGWRDRLSLDLVLSDAPSQHTIDLFQESAAEATRHLDTRIWFDRLSVLDREVSQSSSPSS